jgi:hypothetical protein
MQLRVVDFPHPFGPRRHKICPWYAFKSRFWTA